MSMSVKFNNALDLSLKFGKPDEIAKFVKITPTVIVVLLVILLYEHACYIIIIIIIYLLYINYITYRFHY